MKHGEFGGPVNNRPEMLVCVVCALLYNDDTTWLRYLLALHQPGLSEIWTLTCEISL